MNKQALIERLGAERAALNSLIEPLTADQLLAAGQDGHSIKDALAYLAVCASRMVTLLFSAERGRQPPDISAILRGFRTPGPQGLAEMEDLRDMLKDRPLDLVLSDYHGAHRQLLRRLASWNDADLFDPQKYRWSRGSSIADLLVSQVAEQDAACRAIIASMIEAL